MIDAPANAHSCSVRLAVVHHSPGEPLSREEVQQKLVNRVALPAPDAPDMPVTSVAGAIARMVAIGAALAAADGLA